MCVHPDNPYTLTRQNNVHNSLRIEFYFIFQHITNQRYKQGTKYLLNFIYYPKILPKMACITFKYRKYFLISLIIYKKKQSISKKIITFA